jgi:hypothetical protein
VTSPEARPPSTTSWCCSATTTVRETPTGSRIAEDTRTRTTPSATGAVLVVDVDRVVFTAGVACDDDEHPATSTAAAASAAAVVRRLTA